MVKSHGKKQRAKNKSRRTGASHASAAAGTLHQHTPLPDMSALDAVPGLPGLFVDKDLAARLVAACRAGCTPCQSSLTPKAIEDRATLLSLAGAIYGTLPAPGPIASATTQTWAPLARAAHEDLGAAPDMLEAFDAMSAAQRSELLEDALDHWAMGAPLPAGLVERLVADLSTAPPRQRPADPLDAFREAGVKVVTLDDLNLGDVDTYALAPAYGVMLMQTSTPEDQAMPMLLMYPEEEAAGIEDLEARTDWEHWGLHGMPDTDSRWQVRARISDRSLRGLVHVDADGKDDHELWRASESVTVPDQWWDLLDRVRHILVVGPVAEPEAPGAMEAAGKAGELLAVVARVAFV
ncbi:hypothetical protein ACFCWY_08795 [Streptomyces sp. NPDC056362]|uniref:hypothetical protein n=1 Tax=unclassified Streptomyces TaxID=2593676 RepID=UPI0035DB7862